MVPGFRLKQMASSTPIQVLSMVSDSDTKLALEEFVSRGPGVALAGEATSQDEALTRLSDNDIDVVLLDLSLRGVNAIDLTRQIRRLHPIVRVIICTSFRRADDIFSAMDAGADGYVLKGNHKGLEAAISTVRLGAVWLDPGIANQVLELMVSESTLGKPVTRTLPTGRMPIPLFPHETDLLNKVATSNCENGVCMVDPSFLKKLKRFAPQN